MNTRQPWIADARASAWGGVITAGQPVGVEDAPRVPDASWIADVRAAQWAAPMTAGQLADVPEPGGCGGCSHDEPCEHCRTPRSDPTHQRAEWADFVAVTAVLRPQGTLAESAKSPKRSAMGTNGIFARDRETTGALGQSIGAVHGAPQRLARRIERISETPSGNARTDATDDARSFLQHWALDYIDNFSAIAHSVAHSGVATNGAWPNSFQHAALLRLVQALPASLEGIPVEVLSSIDEAVAHDVVLHGPLESRRLVNPELLLQGANRLLEFTHPVGLHSIPIDPASVGAIDYQASNALAMGWGWLFGLCLPLPATPDSVHRLCLPITCATECQANETFNALMGWTFHGCDCIPKAPPQSPPITNGVVVVDESWLEDLLRRIRSWLDDLPWWVWGIAAAALIAMIVIYFPAIIPVLPKALPALGLA